MEYPAIIDVQIITASRSTKIMRAVPAHVKKDVYAVEIISSLVSGDVPSKSHAAGLSIV
jgi:hypothetical protein